MSRFLIPAVLLTLALLSLVVLKSIAPELVIRQLLFFLLGVVIFITSARLPFSFWRTMAVSIYVVITIGLCTTQVIGRITRGTRSWIPVGAFNIQPSQLAVVGTGLLISQVILKKKKPSLKNQGLIYVLVLIPAALIFTEPDLGSTLVYLCSLAGMLFLGPINSKQLLMTGIFLAVVGVIAWQNVVTADQKIRITSYLNSTQDLQGAGYNAWQSLIAVGSGGIFGRGVGQGVQSQLRFLPERQTDFIFASLTEEMGLVAGGLIIMLYATLSLFCFSSGLRSYDLDKSLICYLSSIFLTVQVGVNIGMNMGLLPITGITLPFLSYGGSSILSLSLQLGIVQNIVWHHSPRLALYIR